MGNGFGFVLGGAMEGLGQSITARVDDMRKQRMLELENSFATNRQNALFAHEDANQAAGFANQSTLADKDDAARKDLATSAADRAAALADVTHGYHNDEEDKTHQYRLQEDQIKADRDDKRERMRAGREDNKADHYDIDDNGEIVAFKNGVPTKTGITSGSKDKDILKTVESAASVKTTTTDDDGNKTTRDELDPAKASQMLRRMGREDLASRYAGDTGPIGSTGGADTSSPIPAQLPTRTKLPAGMTSNDARAQAKAAIAAGKPRAAILDRLKSLGVDSSGL